MCYSIHVIVYVIVICYYCMMILVSYSGIELKFGVESLSVTSITKLVY